MLAATGWSVVVIALSFVLDWSARPLVLSLLFIQAGAIIGRLYVAHVAVVQVAATDDGINVTKQGAPFLFVSYRDISTALDDGKDVCVVLRSGDMLRFGIDGGAGARLAAVRALQSGGQR